MDLVQKLLKESAEELGSDYTWTGEFEWKDN